MVVELSFPIHHLFARSFLGYKFDLVIKATLNIVGLNDPYDGDSVFVKIVCICIFKKYVLIP